MICETGILQTLRAGAGADYPGDGGAARVVAGDGGEGFFGFHGRWRCCLRIGSFGNQLVFKGGTSLSKVFGVIKRFSKTLTCSVSPAFLGISEESVEQAGSRNKRTERMQELEEACNRTRA